MKEDYTQYTNSLGFDWEYIRQHLAEQLKTDITNNITTYNSNEPTTPKRTITATDIRTALHDALATGIIQGVNGIEVDVDETVDAIYKKYFEKEH